jgi:hypothetical protein
MKAQTTVKGGILLFLAAVTCLWFGEGLKAATGDTVADLQAAAKEGLPDALDAKQGIDDINRLLDELRTDSTFAAHFYKTMKSNNRAGLLRLIQPRARNTKVSILSLDNESSFTLDIGFETKKGKVFKFCISNERGCTNKHKNFFVGCSKGCGAAQP